MTLSSCRAVVEFIIAFDEDNGSDQFPRHDANSVEPVEVRYVPL